MTAESGSSEGVESWPHSSADSGRFGSGRVLSPAPEWPRNQCDMDGVCGEAGTEAGSSRDKGESGRRSTEAFSPLKLRSATANAEAQRAPWWAPPLLALAVLSVSSAGAVMKAVVAAAPLALASWRLQATSLVLAPGFLLQLWASASAPPDICAAANRALPCAHSNLLSRALSLPVCLTLGLCAAALAAHFGLWVFSLGATSLPHSLLFVSTPPLLLAAYSLLRGQALAHSELWGLALGAAGVVLVAFSAASEAEVTVVGDLAALGAAVAFAVYVTAGKGLRTWMPLYLYALPVTAGAAIILGLVSAVQWAVIRTAAPPFAVTAIPNFSADSPAQGTGHPASHTFEALLRAPAVAQPHSVYNPFAWILPPFLLPVLYLALGPGFVGHTGLNAVLRYMSPLTISMAITLEPPLGSLLGWLMGETAPPGPLTWAGGSCLVLATVWVACAGSEGAEKRESPVEEEELLESAGKGEG